MKVTRAAAAAALLAAVRCADIAPAREAGKLDVRAPDLEHAVTESFPAPSRPQEPVLAAVWERINADRAAAHLPPVAWDEAASRVARAFSAAQVREGTRGHYLMDGLPPYARTGLAGIFGMGAENVVAWRTTAPTFREPALGLALEGHADMMAEKPPDDGHRRTILDPAATHVGVGWAEVGGEFRVAEEFLTRRLATLTLERIAETPTTILFKGRTLAGYRLEFVTIAREPSPRRLTKAQASAHTRYTFPEPQLAYVPDGWKSLRVIGTETQDRLRVGQAGDFSFRLTPSSPGLWTIVFYTAAGGEKATPGGSALLWIEKAAVR